MFPPIIKKLYSVMRFFLKAVLLLVVKLGDQDLVAVRITLGDRKRGCMMQSVDF